MRKIKAAGICLSVFLGLFTVSLVLVEPVSAGGTDYYVSNTGNNGHAGTSPETAWQTIGKINTELGGTIQPGDNVYFKRGDTFNDAHLTIDMNGVSTSNPTIFGAYGTGDKPLFEGRYLVVDGVHNVTVENISIANITGFMIQVNTGSTYLTLQSIDGYKSSDHAIYFGSGCSHVIIRDCYINITHTGGNDIIHGSLSYGLIENNTFLDAKHSTINLFRHPVPQDEYVIIRNNTFISPRRSLDIYVNNTLIENNHLICEARGSVEPSPEQFCGSSDVIVRDNYLINGSRYFFDFRMTYESGGTQYVGFPSERISLYHNTMHTLGSMGTGGLYDWFGAVKVNINTADYENTSTVVNMTVVNNIVSGIAAGNGLSMYYIDPDQSKIFPVDNLFDTNLIYVNINVDNSHVAFRQDGIPSGYEPTDYIWKYNISRAEDPSFPHSGSVDFDDWVTYVDNVWDDPEFADIGGGNFSLNTTSPANDTAKNLTVTTSSRTSTWVDVNNSQYFWPRITIINMVQTGDLVFVGDDIDLEVLVVDYSNNSFQVNRSITYSIGDGVSLMRYQSSMNIGAYQTLDDFDEPSVLSISNVYPVNISTEVSRPPVNLSAYINGSDVDVYFYFLNMTPTVDIWTLVDSWNSVSDARVEYTTLSSFGTTYEFLWGDTTYTWSVNISDGVDWVNESYSFTTAALSGSGHSLRMDVARNNVVNINDCLSVYLWYTGGGGYNGYFDVNDNNAVNINDCLSIYLEYT